MPGTDPAVPAPDPPHDAAAERLLLNALRRLHRAEPMRTTHRADTVVAAARSRPGPPSPRHRGGGEPADEARLRAALDRLVADGRVARDGRGVRLADAAAALGPVMGGRIDALLAELRAAGASPPRAEPLARRLGIPPRVLDGLRASGRLVALAPGIDYPADQLAALLGDLCPDPGGDLPDRTAIAARLGVTRRFADALHARLERDRRGVG